MPIAGAKPAAMSTVVASPGHFRLASHQRARRWLAATVGCLLTHAAVAALNCTVSSSGMSFGVYTPLAPSPLDVTGSISVNCTRFIFDPTSIAYTVALSSGGGGSFTPRVLTTSGGVLNYNLYTNAAHSIVWGDGGGGSQTVNGTVAFRNFFDFSQSSIETIYGRIDAGQDAAAGSYGDSIVITVTY